MAIFGWCQQCKVKVDDCQSPDSHRAQRYIVWRLYVKPGGRRGRQIRETRLTKALAEAREREIRVLHQRGELFTDERPKRTFADASIHYIEHYLKPNRQLNEIYTVQEFSRLIGATTLLDELTKEKLTEVYQTLKTKMTMASVVRRWTTLQGIFRENADYLRENPAKGVIPKTDRKKANRNKTVYFTNEQYHTLLSSLTREDEKDIVIIFRHTGFRKGDGKGLLFEHCDFNMRTIHILNQKNGEQASIPMVPEVYDRLRGIQKRLGRTNGPVFDMQGIGKRFLAAVKAAGLWKPKPDNLTLHSLRHSFGTYVQGAYKDLNVTKELMRHKSVAMTLRYAHAADEAKRSAAIAASVSETPENSSRDNENYSVIVSLSPEKVQNESD